MKGSAIAEPFCFVSEEVIAFQPLFAGQYGFVWFTHCSIVETSHHNLLLYTIRPRAAPRNGHPAPQCKRLWIVSHTFVVSPVEPPANGKKH
jgi:hypothetical protein